MIDKRIASTSIRDMESLQRAQAMDQTILTRDEEENLARRWKDHQDIEARNLLVRSHEKLLVGMARKFERYGVKFQDLYQEGVLGLLAAAKHFDPDRKVRFNTFAQWQVLSAMQELAARDSNPVRIGKGRKEKAVFRAIMRARSETGGRLTSVHYDKISELCNMPREDVEAIAEACGSRGLSLNQPLGNGDEEGGAQFIDTLADQGASAAHMMEVPLRETHIRIVKEILEDLDPRERRVVMERFLSEDNTRTLRALAEEMNISAERVRQIGRDALVHMRNQLEARGYFPEDILPSGLG